MSEHGHSDGTERDLHLREALRHAPDRDQLPPAALRDTILLAAHAAVRTPAAPPKPATPRWLRWWDALAHPRLAGGLASVMVATLVGLVWWDQPMDEGLPQPASAEREAPVARPSAAAPKAGPNAAPPNEAKKAASESGAPAPAPAPVLAPVPAPSRSAPPPIEPTAPVQPAAVPQPMADAKREREASTREEAQAKRFTAPPKQAIEARDAAPPTEARPSTTEPPRGAADNAAPAAMATAPGAVERRREMAAPALAAAPAAPAPLPPAPAAAPSPEPVAKAAEQEAATPAAAMRAHPSRDRQSLTKSGPVAPQFAEAPADAAPRPPSVAAVAPPMPTERSPLAGKIDPAAGKPAPAIGGQLVPLKEAAGELERVRNALSQEPSRWRWQQRITATKSLPPTTEVIDWLAQLQAQVGNGWTPSPQAPPSDGPGLELRRDGVLQHRFVLSGNSVWWFNPGRTPVWHRAVLAAARVQTLREQLDLLP